MILGPFWHMFVWGGCDVHEEQGLFGTKRSRKFSDKQGIWKFGRWLKSQIICWQISKTWDLTMPLCLLTIP